MKIRVVDFETLTRNFIPYVEGYDNIQTFRKNFISSIDPQKKELESIIRSSTSGLIIDEITQKANIERFKAIQQELMLKDQEFSNQVKKMTDELNKSVYEQLSEIITDWATGNEIDMVMGKMEVIFSNTVADVTDSILQIIKDKNLFIEDKQEELQA